MKTIDERIQIILNSPMVDEDLANNGGQGELGVIKHQLNFAIIEKGKVIGISDYQMKIF